MFIMPPVFNSGDTIYFFFDTYDSNGASVTITGLAVTDIEVYKNGSTTQRSSDNGYALLDTDGIDFDASTGLHGFSIDTSDNSDASFWADGAQYVVHVNAITCDGQTVRFSYLLTLGYLLRPTTAGRKLDVSTGGEAGLDWANVGSPTTTVNLSGTTVKTATDVETDTADIQSRLPAALGANGNMKADVRDFNGTAGTFSAGRPEVNTTHAAGVAWNSGAITAATIATGAVDADAIAADAVTEIQSGLSTLSAAQVRTECEEALQTYHLDHLIASADPGGVVANSSFLAKLVSKSATPAFSSYDNTTDALEALRDRGDAAWITATGFSTHSAADVWAAATRSLTVLDEDSTTIDLDATVRAALGLASANLDTQLSTIDGVADAILADTGTDGVVLSTATKEAIATALLDLTSGVESSVTVRQALRAIAAVLAGLLPSGAGGGTEAFKGIGQASGGTTRVTFTVDSSGNRTAATLNL